MKVFIYISVSLMFLSLSLDGQEGFRFSGQVSSWVNVNTGSTLPIWGGIRYIPQLNFSPKTANRGNLDAELSANIFGSAGLQPFDTITGSGKIKPYRSWIRYSTDQLELRLGLQKLNFGSASMLRPLMWFDQLDPRDPLQLTDGVWGLLARYYFLDNASVWLWGLYGNNERMGWDIIPVNKSIPEFGGRFQLPVPRGEMAFSYNHRIADSRGMGSTITSFEKIPENRFGFDAKWDLKTGVWIEGSFTNKTKLVGPLTNQLVLNTGIDYTFGIGGGVYVAFEQLLASYDEKAFAFNDPLNFSLLTLSVPMGLFDKISTIIYYNWNIGEVYSFLNWQKQFDNIMLYVMAYWNPEQFQLPSQPDSQNIFAGKGIQLMFVYNH